MPHPVSRSLTRPSPQAARRALGRTLAGALDTSGSTGGGLVIAFSGGPDSTALLLVATELARRRRLPLWAVHVDHRLDAGSAGRSRQAERLAERLGVTCLVRTSRRPPRDGHSVEAEARRERYRLLELARSRLGADWILTAHHRRDQLETLLLRIRQGSGVRGLRGIRSRFRRALRPFLDTEREVLALALEDRRDLDPVVDPTNESMEHARNRIRHRLIPALARSAGPTGDAALSRLAGRLARVATETRRSLDCRLASEVELRLESGEASLSTSKLLALPSPLRDWCVALLSERSGEPYPPPGRAIGELFRQLETRDRARCDWSATRRLETRGGRLRVLPSAPPTSRGSG